MDSDHFREEITLKPYLKYQYQTVLIGLKRKEKEAFLRAINDCLNYLYDENPEEKKRILFFLCLKK